MFFFVLWLLAIVILANCGLFGVIFKLPMAIIQGERTGWSIWDLKSIWSSPALRKPVADLDYDRGLSFIPLSRPDSVLNYRTVGGNMVAFLESVSPGQNVTPNESWIIGGASFVTEQDGGPYQDIVQDSIPIDETLPESLESDSWIWAGWDMDNLMVWYQVTWDQEINLVQLGWDEIS